MAKKQETQLHNCLTELNLTTARKQCTELSAQAESESLSYQEFLLSVLEAECQARRIRRLDRRLRESRLPLEKNLETFELKRLPQKINRQIKGIQSPYCGISKLSSKAEKTELWRQACQGGGAGRGLPLAFFYNL